MPNRTAPLANDMWRCMSAEVCPRGNTCRRNSASRGESYHTPMVPILDVANCDSYWDGTGTINPRFKWKGEPRPEYEQAILDELEGYGLDMAHPENLCIHAHQVGDDIDKGPIVTVSGGLDDQGGFFSASYSENSHWVTMDDL